MSSYRHDPVLRNAMRILREATAVLEEDDPEGVDDCPFQQIVGRLPNCALRT